MKIWILNKKTCLLCSIISTLALVLFFSGRNEAIFVSGVKKDLPIYCVEKDLEQKIISISFDAAWGNEDTQNLIDVLKKYNVRTTFFVVGGWVDKYPETVNAIQQAGHEIMNHSNTHPHMTKISTDKMREEIQKCHEKIEKITGKTPFLFRPPYGDYNNKVIQILRELGYYTIQWDVDSLDWKNLSSNDICERVLRKTKPGSIVLFHNAAKNTPKAVSQIIEKLQGDGYSIVPISELILYDHFMVDGTGKQIATQ